MITPISTTGLGSIQPKKAPSINPKLLTPGYVRVRGSNYGIKDYRPAFSMRGRSFYTHRSFKKAEDANNYARALKNRWIRLYDAAITSRIGEPQA